MLSCLEMIWLMRVWKHWDRNGDKSQQHAGLMLSLIIPEKCFEVANTCTALYEAVASAYKKF